MGQFVAICGSLGKGVTVFGPYPSKTAAICDTEERVRGGWCDTPLTEILPLVLDIASVAGEWVLVFGNLKEGFVVYGTYAKATWAANASSPFRPDPLNPNTPDGQRQAVVLRMQPPMTS